MKKLTILGMGLCMALCLTTSCNKGGEGKQSEKSEKSAKAKKKSNKKVFLYTLEHREGKYQPTEPVIAFSKKIGSVNEAEFKANQNLQEVYIGEQIKHIMPHAFEDCQNLTAVHYAADIPVINDYAFKGCTSLKEFICDAYTVGLSCFEGCTSLEKVRFGDHMYWIREKSFGGCKNLKSILMGITLEKLDDNAFPGCTAVEEFSVPQAMKNRMWGYFPECPNLKRVYLLSTEFYPVPKNCTPRPDCTIYVPDVFLAQFKGDAEWSKFKEILPLSQSKYFADNGFWKK